MSAIGVDGYILPTFQNTYSLGVDDIFFEKDERHVQCGQGIEEERIGARIEVEFANRLGGE